MLDGEVRENQNTEFKESWRDEYIKWICGFANANRGTLFIGVDDSGEVVGVDNAKRLLEDIPNKVRDVLGIIVDVNLLSKDDLDSDTFEFFIKKAIASKRLEERDIPKNYNELLEKLRLTEGSYLKCSAILLFHKEP